MACAFSVPGLELTMLNIRPLVADQLWRPWDSAVHSVQIGTWQPCQSREFCMSRFRFFYWILIAAGAVMLSVAPSFAQKPDVGDQPGLLADDDQVRAVVLVAG